MCIRDRGDGPLGVAAGHGGAAGSLGAQAADPRLADGEPPADKGLDSGVYPLGGEAGKGQKEPHLLVVAVVDDQDGHQNGHRFPQNGDGEEDVVQDVYKRQVSGR